MPKHANTVQFSLDSEYLDKLGNLSIGDESLGLTAKRLVLAVIDGEIEIKEPQGIEAIKERLEALERAFDPSMATLTNKLVELEKKIKELEGDTHTWQAVNAQEVNLEIRALKKRLADLEKTITTMTTAASDSVQNQSQPLGDCSPNLADGLSSAELARKLGVGKSSVGRWKEKGKCPQEYGNWRFESIIGKWFLVSSLE